MGWGGWVELIGSCRGGVGSCRVGWVMVGWGGSCRGGEGGSWWGVVGHVG